MMKIKSKLLISSIVLCISLLVNGLFSSSVQASNKIDHTKLIAATMDDSIVNVPPNDIDNIRLQFNNFVTVTGSSGTAYNMSKLLIDILPEVSYINFEVTDTNASILIHKNAYNNSCMGDGVVGITYNYKEKYLTYKFQNTTEFSTDSYNKIIADLFYNCDGTTKLYMLSDINTASSIINNYVNIYKTDLATHLQNKSYVVLIDKSISANYGTYNYTISTSNNGKLYLQIALVKRY